MSSAASVCFWADEMLKHYEEFDPILFKYDIPAITEGLCTCEQAELSELVDIQKQEEIPNWNRSCPQTNLQQYGELLKRRLTNYLRHYEAANDLASLTKRDFSHVMANLHMIYHSEWKKINRQARLIDLVSKRVISGYIGIDGLERLFSDQYIDFEWEMHLGMNHSEHKMDFYRDHFIHQVRDAYMLDLLLEQDKLYQPVLKTLMHSSASKVSQYFCTMVERQRQLVQSSPIEKYLRFDKEFIPRNIIKMAAYMSGIFHDIGYPETYLRSLQRRFAKYMPSSAAINRQQTAIDARFSLLQNSLLFRVVPLQEIQARVNRGKVDHGTLSALAFLLHFYENGIIFKLEPYKAAAIELAALAIYNHTYKYAVSEKPGTKTDENKARFVSNPISYLLRICDDLQEWDRVYFEISSRSNILICPRCQMPIIGKVDGDKWHQYICSCPLPDIKTQFQRAFDGSDSFPYRRVYNVSVCDSVEFEPLKKAAENPTWANASDAVVHLNYDAYRLLHIAYISPGYAGYRIRELNKLKPLLFCQSLLPRLWLDYFVTSNPILIKTKLIGKLYTSDQYKYRLNYKLETKPEASDDNSISAFLKTEREKLSNFINPIIDSWASGENKFVEAVKRSIGLYSRLFLYQMLHFKAKADPKESLWEAAHQALAKEISETYTGSKEFRCLLGDSLLQLSRIYPKEVLVNQEGYPEDYLTQFEPGDWKKALCNDDVEGSPDFYDTAVERYTDQQSYQPLQSNDDLDKIDAFHDLGFFKAIFNTK